MNEQIIKRIKSLIWRALGIGFVASLSAFSEMLGSSGLNPTVIVFVGLVIGEITKYINNKLSLQ